MEALTKKQIEVLRFIEQRIKERKPPGQREIAHHFGVAQNAVFQLIGYLRKKGYLEESGRHRGLRLSDAYQAAANQKQGMPLIGRVAAGEPILAEENIEAYIDLNDLVGERNREVFVLEVSGDSMVDEGIMDGDYVIVQPQKTIEHGQIGVALVNDEATVKRILVQKKRIGLQPANKQAGYKTRYFQRGDREVRIVGKVVGCFRKM